MFSVLLPDDVSNHLLSNILRRFLCFKGYSTGTIHTEFFKVKLFLTCTINFNV